MYSPCGKSNFQGCSATVDIVQFTAFQYFVDEEEDKATCTGANQQRLQRGEDVENGNAHEHVVREKSNGRASSCRLQPTAPPERRWRSGCQGQARAKTVYASLRHRQDSGGQRRTCNGEEEGDAQRIWAERSTAAAWQVPYARRRPLAILSNGSGPQWFTLEPKWLRIMKR